MGKAISTLITYLCFVSISFGQGTSPQAARPAAANDGAISLPCSVQLNEVDGEAYVPAQEAGVLTKISVRAGQHVKTGDLLANIDDAQARKQKENAEAEFSAASEKANSTVDVKAATKAERVAYYAYQSMVDALNKVAKVVSENDLNQKKFEWEKMGLAIEQANHQKVVDGYTAEAKRAESQLAQIGIERREIHAPFDGVIEEIKQHRGEWVKPGDPVLRMIRLDRLSVEGRGDSTLYNPADMLDRPVTVQVSLAGGRTAQFPGKITFVGSEIAAGQRYTIRAEVENRKDNGQWVLRPGMKANMAIQLR